MLRGRGKECEQLDNLLVRAREGHSGTLVVRGEAGIGKTALLDHASETSAGFRVARAIGVQSEMEMPFATLHQLCGRMLERIEGLPQPQADALRVAFGFSKGESPDRFLVGLGALSLLSESAEEQPLLCIVDDAQWLDRASAQSLSFVARRLEADSVIMLFGLRDPLPAPELLGLPEMVVGGLSETDAREVLASAVPGRLDERVRDRIIAEARGNPLALLELPRSLTGDLSGGFGLSSSAPPSGRVKESFSRRASALPIATQRLLLVAAAEPTGDPALLRRAAGLLGVNVEDVKPVNTDELLNIGARVTFRHPLVRSAIYKAAPVEDRERIHTALAEATDPELDPDRRAWHRAQSSSQPDEDVAAELVRSADRAKARGGVAAAAGFLERATELTPDPTRRGGRALAAAQAKFDAGVPDTASKLLGIAVMGSLDDLQRAHVELLRAQIAFSRKRGSDASTLLLSAAKRLGNLDAKLARQTYLETLGATILAGRLSALGSLEVAEAARSAPPGPLPPRALDLFLDALVTRFTEGYAAGVLPLKRALDALRREQSLNEDDMRWFWLAARLAPEVWDDETWHEITARDVQAGRDAGALISIPIAATYRAGVALHEGDFAGAAALIDEADAISKAIGNAPLTYTSLVLAAWRGEEDHALDSIKRGVHDATARGEGRVLALAEYATAVLYNGLGRYDAAVTAAERACEHDDLGLFAWALTELVEAAARSGKPEAAARALHLLAERTSASGTDWALGIEARCCALLNENEAAENLYREAIDRLGRTRIAIHLARAHLLYGEWLRRENRRVDAREHLRTAHEMLDSMGAEAFAQRAARELVATGESARKRRTETVLDLTAQESQIARLAAEGHSNPEIGAQLFISRRTVEYHLHKVFSKLDISSRNHLHGALSSHGIETQRFQPLRLPRPRTTQARPH